MSVILNIFQHTLLWHHDGKFCIKWISFQSNVASAIGQYRENSNYQDVTLVSDDQKQISAHRIVLSAFSGYFNNVLDYIKI